jgi:hypothetical protein
MEQQIIYVEVYSIQHYVIKFVSDLRPQYLDNLQHLDHYNIWTIYNIWIITIFGQCIACFYRIFHT